MFKGNMLAKIANRLGVCIVVYTSTEFSLCFFNIENPKGALQKVYDASSETVDILTRLPQYTPGVQVDTIKMIHTRKTTKLLTRVTQVGILEVA